jgi:hypothetical protein
MTPDSDLRGQVADNEIILPRATVGTDEELEYGQLVRLTVTARVRGVSYAERKDQLIRTVKLSLEEVAVVPEVTNDEPSADDEPVNDSITDDEIAELGVAIKRTGDVWTDPPVINVHVDSEGNVINSATGHPVGSISLS